MKNQDDDTTECWKKGQTKGWTGAGVDIVRAVRDERSVKFPLTTMDFNGLVAIVINKDSLFSH